MWDIRDFSATPEVCPAEGFNEDGVRAVFFDSVPFKGKKTRVFAWMGVPEVAPGKTVPGMVLIHGGGGTAFAEWVRLWNQRGYAAIAMDTCGCVAGGEHGKRIRHEDGGPGGWGGFDQIREKEEDQWTYHAVSAVLNAHSLLRSLPEVDENRIGVTGISWGGYLCSIVSGVDPRFRFAAPVYGCGFTLDNTFATRVQELGAEQGVKWMQLWDPSVYLVHSEMPMLWVSGSNDFAYTLNALQMSYRLAKGNRNLCIRLRMPHGQEQGAAPKEIPRFADSLLHDGPGLPNFTSVKREGLRLEAEFESKVPIAKAELNFTFDTGTWPERRWECIPVDFSNGVLTTELPEKAAVYYLNLTDEEGLIGSSEHEELR